VLLLPEDPSTPVIMAATGTGIAPFRSFWRRLFFEDVPSYKFTGLFWLFMGAANSDGKLYDDELSAIAKKHPENFRLDYALSREGAPNKRGGKMYIQDKIEEYADEIFDLLNTCNAHMYFCGLKGMMPGINEMLERVCKEKGINYEEFIEGLKHENRWHVEVRRACPLLFSLCFETSPLSRRVPLLLPLSLSDLPFLPLPSRATCRSTERAAARPAAEVDSVEVCIKIWGRREVGRRRLSALRRTVEGAMEPTDAIRCFFGCRG
jgi:hypothetical protein